MVGLSQKYSTTVYGVSSSSCKAVSKKVAILSSHWKVHDIIVVAVSTSNVCQYNPFPTTSTVSMLYVDVDDGGGGGYNDGFDDNEDLYCCCCYYQY